MGVVPRRRNISDSSKRAHPTQKAPVSAFTFKSHCIYVMTHYTSASSRHRDLNATESADNKRLADARARIEHTNAWVVYSHEMFHGRPFIGSFDDLHMYVTISVHTTAAMIEMEPTRGEHMGRFNHPHVPR